MTNFAQFKLKKELVAALKTLGYNETSPIQEKAVPLLLKRTDGVFKAPTGSGKTLAYLVPIIDSLRELNRPQAVIIVPTKVLAVQVGSVLKSIRQAYPFFNYDICKDGADAEKIAVNADIIVATPRLFLSVRNKLNLKDLAYLIFDEGDMLIFGGFEAEVAELMAIPLPATKALFTASVDEHLNTLVRKYMKAAQTVDLTAGSVTAVEVRHIFVDIRHLAKAEALCLFLKTVRPYKAIAFVSSKKELAEVENYLLARKISHSFIHGDLPKREQKKALKDFKDDRTTLLLASDIAARGFDDPTVTDVISLDLPKDLTYYFHRAGRTGRFGQSGNSYIFYSGGDPARARELLKKAGPIFTFGTLREEGIKPDRDLNSVARRPKLNNLYVEKEIKKAIAENRSKKVKPCYKKRVKWAIADVKRRHKETIIKTNVRQKNKDENSK